MARRNYAKLVARTTPISYSPSSKSTLRGQSSDDSSVTKPPPASTTEEGWWNEEKITDYSTENRNRKYAPYKISNMEAHRAPGNSANTQNGRPRSFLAPELISTEQKASPYLPASHSSTESPKAEQKESPYKPALYTTPNEKIQMEDSPSDVPVPLKTTEGGWWNEEKRDHFRPKHKHTPYTIRNPELHRAPAPSSNADWWNEQNQRKISLTASSGEASRSPFLPVSHQTHGSPAEQKASPYLPASHSSTESPKAEQKESPYKPALYTTPNETIQMDDSPLDVPVPLKTTEGGWWNEEKRDHFRPKHKHTPYTIRNPELHRAPAPSSNAASSSNTEQGWWNEENKVSYSSDPMNRKYVPYQLIPSGSDEATLRLET
jgi:hypothetical protein